MSSLWFPTASLTDAGDLAVALVRSPDGPPAVLDLRPGGLRVGAADGDPPLDAHALARALGRASDAHGTQRLMLTLDSRDVERVAPFWGAALGYRRAGDVLRDPDRRLPDLRLRTREDASTLRGRPHLDIGFPGPTADLTAQILQAPGSRHIPSEWYGTLVDADRNELDLVAGGPLADDDAVADWEASFCGFASYRCASAAEAAQLARVIAALVDASDADLLIGLRTDRVLLDSGKDRWEAPAFVELARQAQAAAHELGARAERGRLRFVQIGLDAADIPAVRPFWAGVLGYLDVDPSLTDLHDPHWFDPVIFFQPMRTETERLDERNRLQPELSLSPELLAARLDAGLAAGGRVVEGGASAAAVRLADPEGNEITLLSGAEVRST